MFSGRVERSSRNCWTVKPLYLIPARRWQFSSCCLTVSTVSSFFVRLMAALIEVGFGEFLVGLMEMEVVLRRGFLKWVLRDNVWDDGGLEEGIVKRVASMVDLMMVDDVRQTINSSNHPLQKA